MKKSIVDKTIEKRNNGSLLGSLKFSSACFFLCNDFLKAEDIEQPDYFYFIVSYITNVEAFFRHLLKELIDKSPDHLNFTSKILEDHLSKGDLVETIIATGTKKVSAGEIISQAVPISSIEQVLGYFNYLTNGKAKEHLKGMSEVESFKEDFEGEKVEFEFDKAIKSMQDLFKFRHILCHENPEYNQFTKNSLEQCFFNSTGLIELFSRLSDHILGIPELKSEADIRGFASQNCKKKDDRVKALVSKIAEELARYEKDFEVGVGGYRKDKLVDDFLAAQAVWEKFRELDANSFSNHVLGGTAMSSYYFGHYENLTDQRIETLLSAWKEFNGTLADTPESNRLSF